MAFNSGKSAFNHDLPLNACPYPQSKEYKEAWERGYHEAQRVRTRKGAKFTREISKLRS